MEIKRERDLMNKRPELIYIWLIQGILCSGDVTTGVDLYMSMYINCKVNCSVGNFIQDIQN